MTAKEYLEYDQNEIPFIECSLKNSTQYDYDGEDPPYSKYEMADFAESYHKKQLALYDVSNRRELLISFAKYWNDKDFGDVKIDDIEGKDPNDIDMFLQQ